MNSKEEASRSPRIAHSQIASKDHTGFVSNNNITHTLIFKKSNCKQFRIIPVIYFNTLQEQNNLRWEGKRERQQKESQF
jgi:hypothetical protein